MSNVTTTMNDFVVLSKIGMSPPTNHVMQVRAPTPRFLKLSDSAMGLTTP